MAAWIWEASTASGDYRSGTMEADNESAVRDRLTSQGLIVNSVKKKPIELKLPKLGSGVSLKDLVVFTRTFSTMVDAGLPIDGLTTVWGNAAGEDTHAIGTRLGDALNLPVFRGADAPGQADTQGRFHGPEKRRRAAVL